MVFRFEDFEFDEETFRFTRSGEPLSLEPKVLRLLAYLLENRSRLVRKQELLDHVWPESNVSESALTRTIVLLRKALNDDSRQPRFLETVPTLGYRFIPTVAVEPSRSAPSRSAPSPSTAPAPLPDPASATPASPTASNRRTLLLALLAIAILAPAAWYFFTHRPRPLTEKDTLVLADFTNATSDPVFDGTLRQGLAVQLEQSPFLSLISDERIQQVLRRMDQPAGTRLTPAIAREVCERTASVAILDGSISPLGSQYVLGLRATGCRDGEVIAEEQAQAARKEEVLTTLAGISTKLRTRLGESLATVEKYDTPLPEATTSSLEALKAFSNGKAEYTAGHLNAAMPFFRRAVELDPNFALAYDSMTCVCGGLQEDEGARNATKAYALRDKVSEKERILIEARYYDNATGEWEKAVSTYQTWKQTYPRDTDPYISLGVDYRWIGESAKALEEHREALNRDPHLAVNYQNLAADLVNLNRIDEAGGVYKQAEDRNLVFQGHTKSVYLLAFLKGDSGRMAQVAASGMGKPGIEDAVLAAQADTEGWYGRVHASGDFTRRAVESAERNGTRENAAGYVAQRALLEAEVGHAQQARTDAAAALKLAPNRDVQAMASLALVRAGDIAGGQKLADQLDRNFPVSTLVQQYWLPVIRAAIALGHNDPAHAAELLAPDVNIQLASPSLLPIYLHGNAWLALHDGTRAAAEFQKYIDYHGVVRNSPFGALGRLGLARAYAMQGDTAKARAAYQDLLTLWKTADADLPILKQAQTESARLH